MTLLAVVEADPNLRPHTDAIAIRMADEGIPVRAIARTTRLPSDQVYEVLKDAVMRGVIVEIPKDDWPTGTSRNNRKPFAGSPLEQEEELRIACSRCFKTTRLETALLSVLLTRNEVTKTQLHLIIEDTRPGEHREATDPKMVDVIICHLRKKLRKWNLQIETVWGIGYLIPTQDRETAISTLHNFIRDAEPRQVVAA